MPKVKPQNQQHEIMSLSLAPSEVQGDAVQIRFVPLSFLSTLDDVLWSDNAKRHDLDGVLQSIQRYGFIDPPKWDANLNSGKGGLVYGNGRTEMLVRALLEAKEDGSDIPRGIPIDPKTGDWCIPIKFGVDATSEAQAIAAAIDHNNLTMAGGDFNAEAIAEIWEESYIELLQAIAVKNELPVTVDEDDLALLLAAGDNDFNDGLDPDPKPKNDPDNVQFGFGEIVFKVSSRNYQDFLAELRETYGLDKQQLEAGIKQRLKIK